MVPEVSNSIVIKRDTESATLESSYKCMELKQICCWPLCWGVYTMYYRTTLKTAEKERSGTDTYWFLQCQEAVAHPAARCPVTADVCKTLLMIPIWSTEWNFLDGLVHYQTLQVLNKTKLFLINLAVLPHMKYRRQPFSIKINKKMFYGRP